MIHARLTKPGSIDREFEIAEGQSSLGSALENTIVLLDDDIADRFLSFRVEGGRLEVMPAEGAHLKLRQSGRRSGERTAAPGAWTRCTNGSALCCGNIVITLSGIVEEKRKRHFARTITSIALPLLVAASVACFMLGAIARPQRSAGAQPPQQHAPAETGAGAQDERLASSQGVLPVAAVAPPSKDELVAALAAIGLTPIGLDATGNRVRFSLRVPDDAAKDKARQALARFDQIAAPTFYVDAEIERAIATELPALHPGARLNSVREGRATIAGVSTAASQDAVRHALLDDILGLASVEFDAADDAALQGVRESVNGLWYGEFPYVALADGRIVRPGEKIADQIWLKGITRNAITLDARGKRVEVAIP